MYVYPYTTIYNYIFITVFYSPRANINIYIYICMYVCIPIYNYIYKISFHSPRVNIHTYIYVCMYVYIPIYNYIQLYIHNVILLTAG